MQAILASLPLDAWMTVQTTPFTPDAGEPVLAAS
jgi:muconolactone delta-isomerase